MFLPGDILHHQDAYYGMQILGFDLADPVNMFYTCKWTDTTHPFTETFEETRRNGIDGWRLDNVPSR